MNKNKSDSDFILDHKIAKFYFVLKLKAILKKNKIKWILKTELTLQWEKQ